MVAFCERRAAGESPQAALENSYRDVTGRDYDEYRELTVLRLKFAAESARRQHEDRARHQRVITGTGNARDQRELNALCRGLRSAP